MVVMRENRIPIEPERIRALNKREPNPRGRYVLYWMQQAQRAEWNHALEYAVALANLHNVPTLALFGLTDRYPEANARHYRFLLDGLDDGARMLPARGIGFACRMGNPPEVVLRAAKDAAAVVVDAGYMPIQRRWRSEVARRASVAVIQVETDVIVPVATVSAREEYAARTIRPKIKKLVPMFEEIVGKEIAQRLTFMERDGSYIIGLDGEEALFDDIHDVARLLFGSPPGYSKQTDFKVLLRGSDTAVPTRSNLCTVLKTIFPIPRPEYGLSYI